MKVKMNVRKPKEKPELYYFIDYIPDKESYTVFIHPKHKHLIPEFDDVYETITTLMLNYKLTVVPKGLPEEKLERLKGLEGLIVKNSLKINS